MGEEFQQRKSVSIEVAPGTALVYGCPGYCCMRVLYCRYVLYTQPTLDAPASVLLDPNTLSKDGTVALKVRPHSGQSVVGAWLLLH